MFARNAFMPRIPRDIRVLREQTRFEFPADGAGNSRSRHCRTDRIAGISIDTKFLRIYFYFTIAHT